jgi:LysM repeat protein/ribosomal protein L40E
MAAEKINTSQKVCPTCGTRLSENATRCLVCGRAITTTATPKSESDSSIQGPRMPTLSLSLPLAIGLFILLIAIGGGAVYAFARQAPQIVVDYTPTPTSTQTSTVTSTFTATSTNTPVPTATPLPPREYTVKANDSCVGIAFLFNVSVQTIVLTNDLPADCGVLTIGQKLMIPQPTYTPTPQATSTPDAAKATESDCELFDYVVKENDTLGSISLNYNVPGEAIKEYNGLPSDIVQLGQTLKIPLCKRLPTPGPTSTPTPPPPYPAANLLLPADGASFISANDVITLQWSSVAVLRQNESYAVTIEDLTTGTGDKVIDYVSETKYIIPVSLRPSGNTPHIFRWTVVPVRQSGSTKDGQPTYEQAGSVSSPRVFSWLGGGASPTSQP